MFLLSLVTFLGLSAVLYTARADPTSSSIASKPTTSIPDDYPLPHQGNLLVHDPSIIVYNDTFYLFKGAPSIEYFKATNISGPWTQVGTVLNGESIIDKVNRSRPWAPTIIERNGLFYCYYCVSHMGSRNSSIGLATSPTAEPGSWTDHGALINTGTGDLSHTHPYTISNALDPSVMIDPADGKPWLTFGSYWTNLWQVPLSDDMLSIPNPTAPVASQLSYLQLPGKSNTMLDWYPIDSDPQGSRPEEGSWISYKQPYYYLWFSRGVCCNLKENHLPPPGDEYALYYALLIDIC
jgi:arabinan endo-1,5-alpha-L-arabinosidase